MRKYSDGTVKKIISNSLIKGSGFFAHSTFSVKRGARWIRVTQALQIQILQIVSRLSFFPSNWTATAATAATAEKACYLLFSFNVHELALTVLCLTHLSN